MVDEEQALAELAEILARPEFEVRPPTVDVWTSIRDALLEPVLAFLVPLITDFLGAARGQSGWIGLAVVVVSVVLVSVVGVFLVRAVRMSVGAGDRMLKATAAERRARSDALWREAQRLAADGQLAAAARTAYLSALYALDEHAMLRLEGGLTNREHAETLTRLHPDRSEAFQELVRRYDHLRYGGFPVTSEVFTDLSGLVARTRAEAHASG